MRICASKIEQASPAPRLLQRRTCDSEARGARRIVVQHQSAAQPNGRKSWRTSNAFVATPFDSFRPSRRLPAHRPNVTGHPLGAYINMKHNWKEPAEAF